jgi:hypothetical protein
MNRDHSRGVRQSTDFKCLSLDVAPILPSHAPALILQLRSVGTDRFSVVLGGFCGHVQVPSAPNAVTLVLVDSSGNSKRLRYLGPGPPFSEPPFCAGAGGFFSVPLSHGAAYLLPLRLDDYKVLSSGKPQWESGWQPGDTDSLQAEIVGDAHLPFPSFWKGTVTSNKLEIHFPAR